MSVAGIICEYNPFHNGHQYHIETTRNLTGCTGIVCIMSGNFVQRGQLAIADKWTRAHMALVSGADLILELPLPYSISSAEGFSLGAISILQATGIVDFLSFASESGDISKLKSVAKLLETEGLFDSVRANCDKGLSFAAARCRAVSDLSEEAAQILLKPNNILGIEYIKTLNLLNSTITPITMKRHRTAHHEEKPSGNFASATAIRSMIRDNGCESIRPFVPPPVFEIIRSAEKNGIFPVLEERIECAILSLLRRLSADDFLNICDVKEGLQNRICDCSSKATSLSSYYSMLKTKRYAMSRLRRITMSAFLNVNKRFYGLGIPYIRVLGFNDTGRTLLKQMNDCAALPIIIKPAHVKRLNKEAQAFFDLEAASTSQYALAFPDEKFRRSDMEYTMSPIIV